MELKDFIQTVLCNIIDGVEEAKFAKGEDRIDPTPRGDSSLGSLQEAGFYISDKTELVQQVSFDVAVTAVEGTQSKASVGVLVAAVGLGAQGQSEQRNSSVSRVQFKIPVCLP